MKSYIVYLYDDEYHKTLLFSTDIETTASSFCDNFNKRIRNLYEDYYSACKKYRNIPKNWFYESGWNAGVQALTDSINLTIPDTTFDEVEEWVLCGESFCYAVLNKVK